MNGFIPPVLKEAAKNRYMLPFLWKMKSGFLLPVLKEIRNGFRLPTLRGYRRMGFGILPLRRQLGRVWVFSASEDNRVSLCFLSKRGYKIIGSCLQEVIKYWV